MLTNEKLELIHLRAIVAITREALSMHPVPDFKTWAADMSAGGWYFGEEHGRWCTRVDADNDGYILEFLTVEEAIALYADGETPNQKRLIEVTL